MTVPFSVQRLNDFGSLIRKLSDGAGSDRITAFLMRQHAQDTWRFVYDSPASLTGPVSTFASNEVEKMDVGGLGPQAPNQEQAVRPETAT